MSHGHCWTGLLLVSCCSLAFGSADPVDAVDVADLVQRTVTARESFGTATYKAKWTSRDLVEGTSLSRQGEVTIRKFPSAVGLGSQIRIELVEGVYAYDGERLQIQILEEAKVMIVEREFNPASWITGNVAGNLVKPLISDELFGDLAASDTAVRYKGVQDLQGILCHVLETFNPGTAAYSDVRTVFHFAVQDHLLRRLASTGTQVDRQYETTIEVSDLRLDTPVADDAFRLDRIPDQYTVEIFKPVEPSMLLDVGTIAPDWELHGPDGAPHRLSSHRGLPVVLEFWGTWCAPCPYCPETGCVQ